VAGDHESARCARLMTSTGKEVIVDLTTVRLDDFQRVFTSEDNASFEKVLEADKEKLRAKQWWIEGMEKKQNTLFKAQAKALEDGGPGAEPGKIMHGEFKGRNALCFYQETIPQASLPKPRVEVKNTRFTTKQHEELDGMLQASFVARQARVQGEKLDNAFDVALREGRFEQLGTFLASMRGAHADRAVGGRFGNLLQKGQGFVQTPDFAPGVNGLSPLMTYGKVGSTPRAINEEDLGPKFSIPETSSREAAADRLQRAALQKLREQSKRSSKEDRLRALGLTPKGTPASSVRSMGSVSPAASLASKVTPFSPMGQLINRVSRLAKQGGQLGIGSASGRRFTGSSVASGLRRPSTGGAASSLGGSSVAPSPATAAKRSAEDILSGRMSKRSRHEGALPANLVEGLLH